MSRKLESDLTRAVHSALRLDSIEVSSITTNICMKQCFLLQHYMRFSSAEDNFLFYFQIRFLPPKKLKRSNYNIVRKIMTFD